MTLGNKIQELRKQQFLSQDAFAEIMGVTRQSVSKWELDQSYPTTDKLVEIADFFNISLDELMREEAIFTDTTKKFQTNETKVSQDRLKSKEHYWYFIWWALLVILIMILFGTKEYTAGFVISQILVWTTVIYFIIRYFKRRANQTS